MLKSLLIGLDGSPYAQSAVELGIEWARRFDAMVVGLGIVDEPGIRRPEMVPIGAGVYKEHADEVRLGRATRQVEQFLERFSLRCTEAGVAFTVLNDVGAPYEQILREAQRYDVVMLGQRTYFHFATQEGPCETLKEVLKNTPRPVVAVPELLPAGKSTLIAYDGSLQAARALYAFQMAGLNGAQPVHIVTVDKDPSAGSRLADRAVDFLTLHGIKAQVHALATTESHAQVLLEQVRQLDAGLVVMGAYGQSALREFFLGSVTRTFLKECPVPVFLYH